ncbi:hypothetical protein [Rhodanobacter glycinis]|nr:hypothetical protein [Rhodanobacter glycinis]
MTLLHILGALIFIAGWIALGALIWTRESEEPVKPPTVPKSHD